MHFSGLDWAIIFFYLGGTLLAGMYGKRFISGISEYLVAGRAMGVCIGIATLAATENGTVSFMYYAQLGYKTGFSAFMNSFLLGVALIFMGQTGFVVRKLRALRLMTIPEFFEKRFSRNLRILCAVLMATGGILNLGIFLKVEGTFLTIVSGLPIRYLNATMVGILLLETVYTVLGGMVSILITDFIQFVFLSQATVLITIYTIHSVGWGKMHDAVQATMGAGGFNPIINPEYGWIYIIFMILSDLSGDACWQPIEMRGFSTRDPKTSQRVFYWTGIIFLALGLMPMQWGIAALAKLGPNVDSLQAMPLFLTSILPAGILGLVTSGMLAATMSVNSSYLLMEFHYRAGHRHPSEAEAAELPQSSGSQSGHKLACQHFHSVLEYLVHAPRTGVFLPVRDGHGIPRRYICCSGRGSVLEARQHTGSLLRSGVRDRRRHRLLLL